MDKIDETFSMVTDPVPTLMVDDQEPSTPVTDAMPMVEDQASSQVAEPSPMVVEAVPPTPAGPTENYMWVGGKNPRDFYKAKRKNLPISQIRGHLGDFSLLIPLFSQVLKPTASDACIRYCGILDLDWPHAMTEDIINGKAPLFKGGDLEQYPNTEALKQEIRQVLVGDGWFLGDYEENVAPFAETVKWVKHLMRLFGHFGIAYTVFFSGCKGFRVLFIAKEMWVRVIPGASSTGNAIKAYILAYLTKLEANFFAKMPHAAQDPARVAQIELDPSIYDSGKSVKPDIECHPDTKIFPVTYNGHGAVSFSTSQPDSILIEKINSFWNQLFDAQARLFASGKAKELPLIEAGPSDERPTKIASSVPSSISSQSASTQDSSVVSEEVKNALQTAMARKYGKPIPIANIKRTTKPHPVTSFPIPKFTVAPKNSVVCSGGECIHTDPGHVVLFFKPYGTTEYCHNHAHKDAFYAKKEISKESWLNAEETRIVFPSFAEEAPAKVPAFHDYSELGEEIELPAPVPAAPETVPMETADSTTEPGFSEEIQAKLSAIFSRNGATIKGFYQTAQNGECVQGRTDYCFCLGGVHTGWGATAEHGIQIYCDKIVRPYCHAKDCMKKYWLRIKAKEREPLSWKLTIEELRVLFPNVTFNEPKKEEAPKKGKKRASKDKKEKAPKKVKVTAKGPGSPRQAPPAPATADSKPPANVTTGSEPPATETTANPSTDESPVAEENIKDLLAKAKEGKASWLQMKKLIPREVHVGKANDVDLPASIEEWFEKSPLDEFGTTCLDILNYCFGWVEGIGKVLRTSADNDAEIGLLKTNEMVMGGSFANCSITVVRHSFKLVGEDIEEVEEALFPPKNPAALWLTSSLRREYIKIDFDPTGKKNPMIYNLFKGYPLEENEVEEVNMELIQPILDHIKWIYANGVDERYIYLLCWYADMFQNPKAKPGVALAFHSLPGAGKDIIHEILFQHILGYLWCATNDIEELSTRFNSRFANKLLVKVSEIGAQGGYKNAQALKSMITDKWQKFEKKFLDSFELASFQRFIFHTNCSNSIYLEKHDRRFFANTISNARRGDTEYFDKLLKCVEDPEVHRHFYTYLRRYKITVDLRKIPETDWRTDLKEQNLPPFERFLTSVCDDAELLEDFAFEGAKEPSLKYKHVRIRYPRRVKEQDPQKTTPEEPKAPEEADPEESERTKVSEDPVSVPVEEKAPEEADPEEPERTKISDEPVSVPIDMMFAEYEAYLKEHNVHQAARLKRKAFVKQMNEVLKNEGKHKKEYIHKLIDDDFAKSLYFGSFSLGPVEIVTKEKTKPRVNCFVLPPPAELRKLVMQS